MLLHVTFLPPWFNSVESIKKNILTRCSILSIQSGPCVGDGNVTFIPLLSLISNEHFVIMEPSPNPYRTEVVGFIKIIFEKGFFISWCGRGGLR